MTNLYNTLGVSKNAEQAEIKSAYRKLAKKYHPDTNKDDKTVSDKFKEVSSAYSVLGDKDKRARYDRGEIDDQGNERGGFGSSQGQGNSDFASAYNRAYGNRASPFEFSQEEDIFSNLFGFGKTGKARARGPGGDPFGAGSGGSRQGSDKNYKVTIGFEEAARGSSRRLTLDDGKEIDIKIPAGITNGQQIRLKGKGTAGIAGGTHGDALVKITIAEHPLFKRENNNIYLDLPISIDEAVLGAQIEVPTIHGRLTIKIPKGSSSGKRLRLKGKGIKKGAEEGDQYVTLKVMVPLDRDKELEDFLKDWDGGNGDALRKDSGF